MKYNREELNIQYGQQIRELYEQDKYLEDIAEQIFKNKKLNYLVKDILILQGVKIRNRSETKRLSDKNNKNPNLNGRKYQMNENYFKTYSHNMAYLLGYISTDGCIHNGVLKLGLQRKDEELLHKIKEELEFTGPIRQAISKFKKDSKEYETSLLDIHSKIIYEDLKKCGITENKSLTISNIFIPEEYEMDFLLGVADGDGSIGKLATGFRIKICSGSEKFIKYIQTLLYKNGLVSAKITKSSSGRKNSIYEVSCNLIDSFKFYQLAYKHSTIYLKRKKDKFEQLIKERREYQEKSNKKLKIYI